MLGTMATLHIAIRHSKARRCTSLQASADNQCASIAVTHTKQRCIAL